MAYTGFITIKPYVDIIAFSCSFCKRMGAFKFMEVKNYQFDRFVGCSLCKRGAEVTIFNGRDIKVYFDQDDNPEVFQFSMWRQAWERTAK